MTNQQSHLTRKSSKTSRKISCNDYGSNSGAVLSLSMTIEIVEVLLIVFEGYIKTSKQT